MKNTKRMLAVAFLGLVVVMAVGPDAEAAPPYSREVYYYVNCGGSSEIVGTAYRDCNGHWTYEGQQSGDWKEVVDVECYGNEIFVDYYEYCNGQWVHVSFVDCSC
jgi:hypothetical protein